MNNYYIYAHIRPDTNEIFYIGKGKGKRATVKYRRNKIWNDIVRKNNDIFQIVILHKDLFESEALELEILEISKIGRLCNNTGCLSNLTLGGEGTSGYVFSKEHRQKISKALSGTNHPLFGKKHSIEHVQKMSKSLKGKESWNKGLKHTEETKEKIRKKAINRISTRKGYTLTENQKEKLSSIRRGKATYQSKKVRQTCTNIIVANSAVELYNKIDCNGRSLVTIQAYLNGNTKKPEWFTYEYVKD
jgi:hypothetical protein